jgi:hypothetical protein
MTGEAIIEARTGNTAGAMQRLSRLRDLYGDSAVYQQAQVLAQLRQVDGAVAALERSFVVKDSGLLSMAADPFLDPVRNDPQFGELLKKMKFPS